jgi:hypothetical protein
MSLVLDSLEIKNFRAFKHLRIEKLGRVNLIVGKNNVGKSSVLEALWLYILRGEPAAINQMLWDRDEMPPPKDRDVRRGIVDAKERIIALNSLFHGRIDTGQDHKPISIGAVNSVDNCVLIDIVASDVGNHIPHISITIGTKAPAVLDTQNYYWGQYAFPPDLETNKYTFILAEGLNSTDVGTFWDRVALSDLEKEVVAALKIVAPDVEAINLVGIEGKDGQRTAKVRIHGMPYPISLRSLGEGMNRMFGIALALVNAKDGMLLIDEVDTGLHYSVLPDLWKLIFEVAHRLNVQVFATSHSWDCIQAFQLAAEENKEEEGVLIRLENRRDGISAVTFDEEELSVVAREQIEVR